MLYGLDYLLTRIYPNPYMQMLFIFGAGAFLTWWFLQGLLNPFIKAAVGIVVTGLFVVVSFFISPILWVVRLIYRFIQQIFAPVWVKISVFILIGVSIFILDHFYNIKIYAEDQTTFYHIIFLNKTYWITLQAIEIGGFFLFLASIYLLGEILKGLDWILNRMINISIIIHR